MNKLELGVTLVPLCTIPHRPSGRNPRMLGVEVDPNGRFKRPCPIKTRPRGSAPIVSVRGSVVDIRFASDLPPINTLLRVGSEGRIYIEVWAQLDAQRVRGIAREREW